MGVTMGVLMEGGPGSVQVGGEAVGVLLVGCGLLEKAVEKSAEVLGAVWVDMPEDLVARRREAKALRAVLDGNVEREVFWLEREVNTAAQVGLALLLEKLSKLRKAQVELGVTPAGVDAQVVAAQVLVDRLRDAMAGR